MKNIKLKGLAQAAVIACLYAVLTLMPGLSSLSYGAVQLRVSEALTILPLLTPWAVPGLAVGCAISNLFSPMMALDLPFGTLASLLAALCTCAMRRKPLAAISFPALFNGLIIGLIITLFSETGYTFTLMCTNMVSVAIGEAIVCYILGYPLYKALSKTNIFKK